MTCKEIIKAALLFYKNFVGGLISVGFKLNPHYAYVSNKRINGKQIIMVWHVDGLKVSQKSIKLFTIMEKWLKKHYRRLFEGGSGNMKISRDNIHEY